MTYTPHRPRYAMSDRFQLGLGSIAVVTYLGLVGCDSGPPEFKDAHFTSVTECVRAGFPDRLCEDSYNAAWANYFGTAPRYGSMQSCEAEWGAWRCMERDAVLTPASGPSAGSAFVPLLAGFVVSQALQRRYYDDEDDDSTHAYRGSGGSGARYGAPLYRTRAGQAVEIVPPARAGERSIVRPVNVDTVTVARSGFGGVGRSRGFGG